MGKRGPKPKPKNQQPQDYDKTITIGLPLPEVLEYAADVSISTRKHLDMMYSYMRSKGFDLHEMSERGINVADNHNRLAQRFVGDWLLICGSDHTFAPDALELLWNAAHKPIIDPETKAETFPRIIGAVIPHRHYPYAYVATNLDKYGERPSAIVPFLDFHPAMTMKETGHVIEIGTIGSGFCLYHRSVFDTLPYPWFLFAKRGLPQIEAEKTLRDFSDGKTFPQFLEDIANGKTDLTDEERELLKAKPAALRRALAKIRSPFAFGPDYHINVAAKEYGFKTYAHLGCTVFHIAFTPIHLGHYIGHLREKDGNYWSVAMRANPPTIENVQVTKQLVEGTMALRNLDVDALIMNYDDQATKKAEDMVPQSEEAVGSEDSEEEEVVDV